jgi:hypothetical protein
MDSTFSRITPINVVMKVLEISLIKRLVVPHIGLIEDETVEKKGDVTIRAFEIG